MLIPKVFAKLVSGKRIFS